MVDIVIDGRNIKAERGSTLLQNAQALKIDIPTLCFHKSLSSFGACRLCMVEVKTNGEWHLAASCHTEVIAGMAVKTNSETVKKSRRFAAELLYYKYPTTKAVRDIAQKLGVDISVGKTEDHDCILCGLCTRTCHEVVGVNALRFKDRGLLRDIEEPAIEFTPEYCIGCGSCAHVCPTGFVKVDSVDGDLIIWNKRFELLPCKICGKKTFTKEFINYMIHKRGLTEEDFEICDENKRLELSEKVSAIVTLADYHFDRLIHNNHK